MFDFDQFLETVPVLTVSGSVDVQARILQQLGNDFLTDSLRGFRQFVVEFHGAIGRSITLHGDVLRSTSFCSLASTSALNASRLAFFSFFLVTTEELIA